MRGKNVVKFFFIEVMLNMCISQFFLKNYGIFSLIELFVFVRYDGLDVLDIMNVYGVYDIFVMIMMYESCEEY